MPQFLRISSLLISALALAACQGSPGVGRAKLKLSGDQDSVIGGISMLPADGLAHSEVYLKESTDKSKSTCTGILISPQVVLTAAHCVLNSRTLPQNVQITFFKMADQQSKASLQGGGTQLAEVVLTDSEFDPNHLLGGHDLALVRVHHAFTDSTPATLLTSKLPDLSQTPIEVSGFGRTVDANVTDSSPVLNLRKTTVTLAKDFDGLPVSLLLFDQKTQGVCRGDSGGPAVIKLGGQDQVLGIASFVFNIKDRAKACSGQSAYSNLVSYRDWLKAGFAQISNEENPI